jgi:1-phosphatidylinositol-5-phosphate 4-kinase
MLPFHILIFSLYECSQSVHVQGSTQGRISTEEERREKSVALKDLDYIDEKEHGMQIDDEIRQILIDTIKVDSDVLAEMKIMDYSLLLGIHELSDPSEVLVRNDDGPTFERDSGGLRSINRDGTPGK